jgi:hypothetical protein
MRVMPGAKVEPVEAIARAPRGPRSRADLLSVTALLLVGSLAFYRLGRLPAFEDEGTQLRWIARAIDAGEWLQPFAEGRPLQVWPFVLPVRLGGDPLLVIRASNVLLGMAGSVLTFRLASRFGGRRAALASGVLFAVCPFVVYLQRLALADMLLCVAGTGVALQTLRFLESPTTGGAALLGVGLVVAAFSKLPVGFVFVLALPAALALLPGERSQLLRPPVRRRVLLSHAPVTLLGLLVVGVAALRASRGKLPGFGLQTLWGMGYGEFRALTKAYGVDGVSLGGELAAQLSWPVVVAGALGVAFAVVRGDGRQRWLAAMGGIPMLAIGLGARFWFSRYLLFTLPPLIVCAVLGWTGLLRQARGWRVPLGAGLVSAALLVMGRESALLILDPPAASWSRVDRIQYLEGGGSGYGYPEAARFVLDARSPPAVVYSLDGHSAYQLRSYLPPEWRARVRPVFFGRDGENLRTDADRRAQLLETLPVWVVAPQDLLDRYLESSFGPAGSRTFTLRRVAAFDKPGSRTRLTLQEVVPGGVAE